MKCSVRCPLPCWKSPYHLCMCLCRQSILRYGVPRCRFVTPVPSARNISPMLHKWEMEERKSHPSNPITLGTDAVVFCIIPRDSMFLMLSRSMRGRKASQINIIETPSTQRTGGITSSRTRSRRMSSRMTVTGSAVLMGKQKTATTTRMMMVDHYPGRE
jgi:hypothetical protein